MMCRICLSLRTTQESWDLDYAPAVGLWPVSRLLPEVRAIAASFFFEHAAAMKGGPIVELLKQMYRGQASPPDPLVNHATSAASLVAMHGDSKLPHLRAAAASEYARCLQLAQTALQDPAKSKSDELLISVIMMGMYERSSAAVGTIDASKHGRGAVALVRHRGHAQFKYPDSYKVFGMVRSTVIMKSAAASLPLDEQDLENFWFAQDETDQEPDASERLQRLMASLPALRYRSRSIFDTPGVAPDRDRVERLLADVKVLDTKLQYWVQTLPSDFQYTTHKYDAETGDLADADSYYGMSHTYINTWLPTVYNQYRVLRIFVQSIIAQCLSCLAQSLRCSTMPTSFLHTASLHTVKALVDDIACSVPQFLGKKAAVSINVEGQWTRGSRAVEGLVAFWLVKPLCVAITVEGIDPDLRHWIYRRLQYIGREFGFTQGLAVMAANATLPVYWRPPDSPKGRYPAGVLAI